MDNYTEKAEKKANECVDSLTAVIHAYKSSRIQLNSVAASSGDSAIFSADLKRLYRKQMYLLVDNYLDTEDSDVPTVPSPISPLGVASTSQAAVPSQVAPTSVDLSIAVSQGSHEQHQLASSTSGQRINSLPTVPVSAHPNNEVNVESSGRLMSHLQFASGDVSHSDTGKSGNSTATVSISNIGQVQSSAGQVGNMTANQEGEEEAVNSLLSDNAVDVPAHSQQSAAVSTAATPNVTAQAEMANLANVGNANVNSNIDNVSVKQEIESPSPTYAANCNYEEELADESVKSEELEYDPAFQRPINVSSEEEDNVEEQVTNAEEHIDNAKWALAIQERWEKLKAVGAPLTTAVAYAGEEGDTLSDVDVDEDSVSVKSEDTSECECDSMLAIEDIKEEEGLAEANEDDIMLAIEGINGSQLETQEENTANEQVDNSADNNVEEQSAEEMIGQELANEADNNEPVPSISTANLDSLPSTSDGHRRSTRAKKQVNYAAPIINSESSDDEELVGQRSVKRKGESSGAAAKKAKHSHDVQQSTVAARPSDHRDEPLKVITRSLNCPQTGCNTVCPNKTSLNGHLRAKHAIGKYRCIVGDCTASFNKKNQLSAHLRGHGDPSDWPCGKCECSFTCYSDLYSHHYHKHEEGLFACSADGCDFERTIRRKVQNHLRHCKK